MDAYPVQVQHREDGIAPNVTILKEGNHDEGQNRDCKVKRDRSTIRLYLSG